MMVASLDPVGQTVSMVSIPRDLVNVPLGDGNVYGPKLNSLMSYADRHPDDFPQGGMPDARGRGRGAARHPDPLLRDGRLRRVHRDGRCGRRGRHRRARRRSRPGLRRVSTARRGWSRPAGPAPLRRRRGARLRPDPQGARRERLHPRGPPAGGPRRAARTGCRAAGACSSSCPSCSTRSGDTIRTDMPVERLPELAAIMDEIGRGRCHERRHQFAAGPPDEHALRRLAGPRPRRDPGDGGGAVHGRPASSRSPGRRPSRRRSRADEAPKATPDAPAS